ncbi:uncharacterized protein Bfra_003882oa [Botrytis fragariae]|uniref:Uncharacterized protein n=1 Tax=Botrytis fragariae TaxID=1964551 RepID=A0A8H6AXH6_9HELO|nr:uncharacterized protein Bfra_003882oa [Botrytis fragariae]KAF5875428.1 hypothetical protein Bfra_003882oa [Botrytis fragariae]
MTNIAQRNRPLFGSKKNKNQGLRVDTTVVHSTPTDVITPPSSGAVSNSAMSTTDYHTTRGTASTITLPESPVSPLGGMNPIKEYRRNPQADMRVMVEGADIPSPVSAEFTEHVSEVVEDEEIGTAENRVENLAEHVRPVRTERRTSFWRFKGKGNQRETDEVTPPVSGGAIDGSNSRASDGLLSVKVGPSGGFPWFKRMGSGKGQEKEKAKAKPKEESEEIDEASSTTPAFNSPSWSSNSTSSGKWKGKENENEGERRRNKSEGEVALFNKVREGEEEDKKGKRRRWTLPRIGRKIVIDAKEKESPSERLERERLEREREERNIANRTKYPDGVLDCVGTFRFAQKEANLFAPAFSVKTNSMIKDNALKAK